MYMQYLHVANCIDVISEQFHLRSPHPLNLEASHSLQAF